ncbi:MAG TPA: polysaccharide biosynthesis/export family protein [Thermoanaerobaculia bacterium]|nr:polysaccharide biosynthesis/export family protein [Thermoanaerobaculia bacterium]
MSRIGYLLLVLAGAVALASPAAGQGVPGGGYRIGPRDVVDVKVFEDSQLNAQYQVNEEGAIRLPLVGNVLAEGLTEEELAARLKAVLEGAYLQRASVSVEVVQFRSRPISVLGAVSSPGPLNYPGRLTLIEALTLAGGLSGSQGPSVHILRRASNGLTDQVTVSLDDLLGRADTAVNLPIFANDLINVPAAEEVTIYMLGEVAGPGAITFKSTERISLLAAIAHAGGLTERASNKIRLQRRTPGGGVEETVVRYKRLIAGEVPDPELRQGDVVIVKESFF